MADGHIDDVDDQKLDMEALEEQAATMKEIESIGLDQDRFDDIEREFKQFLEEIIGNQNL